MRTSPGGFTAFCSSILSERAPKPPKFIGQSTWTSRTGSISAAAIIAVRRSRPVGRTSWTFCPGDKVMQTENEYDKEVHNGDVGIVSRIDLEESELTAEFEGREDGLDRSVWHRHRY